MPTDADYTIADLARLTGLNVRTIRYWISQGLLPASGEAGPGAHYGQGHLDRLRLIKRLQAEYLPNAEIRRRLAPLSDAEVGALVTEDRPPADPARPTTSALDYVRGILSGSDLTPGAPTEPMPIAAYRVAEEQTPGVDGQAASTSGDQLTPAARSPSPPPAAAAPPIAAPPARPARYARIGMDLTARQPATSVDEKEAWASDVTGAASRATATPATAPDAATHPSQPERSQWERLQLTDNIELHIRRPLSRPEQRRVERLITIARQVLNEGGEG